MTEPAANEEALLTSTEWPTNLVGLPPLGRSSAMPLETGAAPSQPITVLTSKIAHDEQSWTSERARKLEHIFDEIAPTWDLQFANNQAARMAPVWDAIDRGGPVELGSIADVGAGTATSSIFLRERFRQVIGFDLSYEMLRRGPRSLAKVQADASQLPVASGALDAVLLMNAFVFPTEIDRVLAAHGVLIWVSSLGAATPIYLPPQELIKVMPGNWQGRFSGVGSASWVVLRRG